MPKIQTLTATLILFTSAILKADVVELIDKTIFKGNVVYITETELGLKHFAASKPLRIKSKMVKHIHTDANWLQKNYDAYVLLKNGDSTPATPISLKDKVWTFDIPHMGKKEIPEASIKLIRFDSSIYKSIYQLDDKVESLPAEWNLCKGVLNMLSRGTVTIPSKLEENVKFSFKLKSSTSPLFRLFIGVKNKEDLYRQHCLFLQLTKNSFSLIALQHNKERTLASSRIDFSGKEQNLEFHIAAQDGYVEILANKKQLAKIHVPQLKLKFSGGKMHLMNDQAKGNSTQISDLKILSWNYPATQHLDRINKDTLNTQWVSSSPRSSKILSYDRNAGTFTFEENGKKISRNISTLTGISYTGQKPFTSPEATLLSTGAKLSLKKIRLRQNEKIKANHPILKEIELEKDIVMKLQGGFPSLW